MRRGAACRRLAGPGGCIRALSIPAADSLTLGLKLESNVYTGWEKLPNARLAWKPTDESLVWGAVSRAVRAPARRSCGDRLRKPRRRRGMASIWRRTMVYLGLVDDDELRPVDRAERERLAAEVLHGLGAAEGGERDGLQPLPQRRPSPA